MESKLDIEKRLLSEYAIEGNSFLLHGNNNKAVRILKEVYDCFSKNKRFVCLYHEASKINSIQDFFMPIIKSMYNPEIYLKIASKIKNLDDEVKLNYFADTCMGNLKDKRLFVFIDGIEELFFKLDFPDYKDSDFKKIRLDGSSGSKFFGNTIRAGLFNKGAVFLGTIKDLESIAFKTTLGNYTYMFYIGNFGDMKIK